MPECPRCASRVDDTAQFCPACGTNLRSQPPPAQPPPPQPPPAQPPPAPAGPDLGKVAKGLTAQADRLVGGAGPVPDYFVPSLVTIFCCCAPLGIAGVVLASRARTALGTGDLAAATAASNQARACFLGAVALGLVTFGLFAFFLFLSILL